jgi:two-component system, NarL family, invasion response regulator UvrY
MQILIIDDHIAVRRGVAEMLETDFPGAKFGLAESEVEALQYARSGTWDVAILDLNLKARGGLDLIRELKDQQPQMRILIYTMHPEEHFGLIALRAGADGYLTKDSGPEELGRAVHRIVSGSRYISPALADLLAQAVTRRETTQPQLLLSDREYQVLQGLASGKSLTGMAEELSLSVKTVSTYRSRVLEKLHLTNNSELVRYALENKLIT